MNVRTGRVTWSKPKILGTDDIKKISHGKRKGAHKVKRKPRFTAAELTTDGMYYRVYFGKYYV